MAAPNANQEEPCNSGSIAFDSIPVNWRSFAVDLNSYISSCLTEKRNEDFLPEMEEENPHLIKEIPGSWDILFKKWVLGVLAALALAFLGFEDLFRGKCSVPVPQRRQGLNWMELTGAGARWFGMVQIGCAAFLHGRFFWRYHRRLWKHFHALDAASLALTSISVILTYIYLWARYFL